MPAEKPKFGYEVPESMRSMAEANMTQARHAFDEFMGAAAKAMTTFEGQAKVVQSGAMDMNRKAMDFAEANVAATLELAERLVRAKDMQEMVDLQQEFIRVQMDRMGQQARELGERASSVGRKAARP